LWLYDLWTGSNYSFSYFLSIHDILLVIPNAGKVTSLVAKKDVALATKIEEAIKKNESLEALTTYNVRRPTNPQSASTKGRTSRPAKTSSALKVVNQKGRRGVVLSSKSSRTPKDTTSSRRRSPLKIQPKAKKSAAPRKAKLVKPANNSVKVSKSKAKPEGRKAKGDILNKLGTKLSVVGFRGRSSGRSAQSS
jgi:hypothetical protein